MVVGERALELALAVALAALAVAVALTRRRARQRKQRRLRRGTPAGSATSSATRGGGSGVGGVGGEREGAVAVAPVGEEGGLARVQLDRLGQTRHALHEGGTHARTRRVHVHAHASRASWPKMVSKQEGQQTRRKKMKQEE